MYSSAEQIPNLIAYSDKVQESINGQLEVLAYGFTEIQKQVMSACAERGILLKKIWESITHLVVYEEGDILNTPEVC